MYKFKINDIVQLNPKNHSKTIIDDYGKMVVIESHLPGSFGIKHHTYIVSGKYGSRLLFLEDSLVGFLPNIRYTLELSVYPR